MTRHIKTHVRNPDIVCKTLYELNRSYHIPWRKIATLDDYRGIPAGTLASIAKGDPIPRKWYKRLGIREMQPAPVCPRCGIVHVAKRCTRRAVAWSNTPIVELPTEVLRWKLEHREPA